MASAYDKPQTTMAEIKYKEVRSDPAFFRRIKKYRNFKTLQHICYLFKSV